MRCKIVSSDDLDRILGRMYRCAAMLSVLIDSGLFEGCGTALEALCGVNELLELSCETLQDSMDVAKNYPEGGPQDGSE